MAFPGNIFTAWQLACAYLRSEYETGPAHFLQRFANDLTDVNVSLPKNTALHLLQVITEHAQPSAWEKAILCQLTDLWVLENASRDGIREQFRRECSRAPHLS